MAAAANINRERSVTKRGDQRGACTRAGESVLYDKYVLREINSRAASGGGKTSQRERFW